MSIDYCGWRPLPFQGISGNDHRLGQIDLPAADCPILSPAIPKLTIPGIWPSDNPCYVIGKQKSRAILLPAGLITAFAAAYITLTDYQTAKSPRPPSHPPLKKGKRRLKKNLQPPLLIMSNIKSRPRCPHATP